MLNKIIYKNKILTIFIFNGRERHEIWGFFLYDIADTKYDIAQLA